MSKILPLKNPRRRKKIDVNTAVIRTFTKFRRTTVVIAAHITWGLGRTTMFKYF